MSQPRTPVWLQIRMGSELLANSNIAQLSASSRSTMSNSLGIGRHLRQHPASHEGRWRTLNPELRAADAVLVLRVEPILGTETDYMI